MADAAGQSFSSSACFIRRKADNPVAFRRAWRFAEIIVYKNKLNCGLFVV
jgi:hypothetical protein